MKGLFVTGTDTGVGKTFVAAALAAKLAEAGHSIALRKPILTGLDEPAGEAGRDDELLAGVALCDPDRVTRLRFGPPVSPHLAAEIAGTDLDVGEIAQATIDSASENETLIVEGVGGLLVPISRGRSSVADLAVKIGLPIVIAARPGLGTISHTLLTVDAARARNLDVRGIVLGPWPAEPSAVERDNLRTIAETTGVATVTLPHVSDLTGAGFAAAAAGIPAGDWL